MRINSTVYRQVYEKLWDKFLKNEWNRVLKPKRYAQSLWRAMTPSNKYIVLEKLLNEAGIQDERYYYRRYREMDPVERTSGNVDAFAICQALEYLGFKVPENIQNRENLLVRTSNLLQQFIDQHCPVFKGGEILFDLKDKDKRLPTKGIEPFNTNVFASPDDTVNGHEDDVRVLLMSFYERIGSKDFKEAWTLMTEDFQNRAPWHGNIDRFIEGYTNTDGIRDVMVFKIQKRFSTVYEAHVYYEDEIAGYTSPSLSSIPPMAVKDLSNFIDDVKKLEEKVSEYGGKNFEQIELYKLFEPAASEYIWYKCGIKEMDISKVFPTRKTIFIRRLYSCTCKMIEGNWLINSIKGVPIQSAR